MSPKPLNDFLTIFIFGEAKTTSFELFLFSSLGVPRDGRSGFRCPAWFKDLSRLRNVQTVFDAHTDSYSVGTGD